MTHPLAIHAFGFHKGRRTPFWRSDAWLNKGTVGPHLVIIPPPAGGIQLDLFGATA